jgi:hypothetical protein
MLVKTMPLIKATKELVLFYYVDGTQGGWIKTKGELGEIYGHSNRTQWTPSSKHPDPIQYTEILEMSSYVPMLSKQLEQLMLLYNLNKDNYHGDGKT